jgi:hypothetical protein
MRFGPHRRDGDSQKLPPVRQPPPQMPTYKGALADFEWIGDLLAKRRA